MIKMCKGCTLPWPGCHNHEKNPNCAIARHHGNLLEKNAIKRAGGIKKYRNQKPYADLKNV